MNEDLDKEKAFLKEIAPTLFASKIGSETDAPEGYFDDLEAKIKSRIVSKPLNRKPSMRRKRLLTYGIAAGLAVILSIANYTRYVQNTPAGNELTETETLEIVLPDDAAALETLDAYYADELLEDEPVSPEFLAELSLNDIADEEIINYLLEPTALDDELLYESFY